MQLIQSSENGFLPKTKTPLSPLACALVFPDKKQQYYS